MEYSILSLSLSSYKKRNFPVFFPLPFLSFFKFLFNKDNKSISIYIFSLSLLYIYIALPFSLIMLNSLMFFFPSFYIFFFPVFFPADVGGEKERERREKENGTQKKKPFSGPIGSKSRCVSSVFGSTKFLKRGGKRGELPSFDTTRLPDEIPTELPTEDALN